MIETRKQFTGKQEASGKIIQQLTRLPEWQQAKTVCIYKSMQTEVRTEKLQHISGKHVIYVENILEEKIDLFIIPGVAFDKNGNRLGRGRGFYDKLLAGKNTVKIGLAFEKQIVDTVPRTDHDIQMDFVVTERGVYGKTKTS